ncbi:MAG: 16S rRNA (cytosine(1402)-N(4))-methyltransferase RsmH [bacterium]
MKNKNYHTSVLTKEVLQYLNPQPGKIYVDATLGGGGHTQTILNAEPKCTVISIDWDELALQNAQSLKKNYGDRLELVWGNFAQLYKLLKQIQIKKIDGILADFGTSQYQIHHKAGFSFQQKTPLDMRMSPAHQKITAQNIIDKMSEKELAQIFFKYGEEKKSFAIAHAIVEQRKIIPIQNTRQLADLIYRINPPKKDQKIHPATKVFQALRIVVNKELENINTLLKTSLSLLNVEGKMVFISFHSLEDRIVKNFFRENSHILKILTPKAITATETEIKLNPSARSAKLRAAEKTVKD